VEGIAGKNESLEVVRREEAAVVARRENGEIVSVAPAKHANSFGVFEQLEIAIAAGDRILLQENRTSKRGGFEAENGELVTVSSIRDGAIELTDGRTLPANYKQFAYGYAVTAHRGQSKSVDFVVASGDRFTHDEAYVAYSRGRKGIAIITSDAEQLRESIGVSGERQSASELARRANLDPDNPYQIYQQQIAQTRGRHFQRENRQTASELARRASLDPDDSYEIYQQRTHEQHFQRGRRQTVSELVRRVDLDPDNSYRIYQQRDQKENNITYDNSKASIRL
jgi:hypothetical protein